MSLSFVLKTAPEYEVDMSPLLPEKLQGLNQTKIKNIKLTSGKQKIAVSSLFKVTGKFDGESIHIQSHNKLNAIGKEMTTGSIYVEGNAGQCLGQNMKNGRIEVHGHVGNWAACNMKGGSIHISGNAGDFLGAGKSTAQQGMAGGMVCVQGHAGDRVGDRMRRGTIFIAKNSGDYCGSRMIAGSIIVMGAIGRYPGYAMKRGTIIITSTPDHPLATFRHCGETRSGIPETVVQTVCADGATVFTTQSVFYRSTTTGWRLC